MERVEQLRDLHQRLGHWLNELIEMRQLITELIGKDQVELVKDQSLERASLMLDAVTSATGVGSDTVPKAHLDRESEYQRFCQAQGFEPAEATARLYDVLASIAVELGVGANIVSPDGRVLQRLDTPRVARLISTLKNPPVKNLADLTTHSYDDLVSIPGFAINTLRKVAYTLEKVGTALSGAWPDDYWQRSQAARREAKKAV